VIDALKDEFDEEFLTGKLVTYEFTYGVRVQIDEEGNKSNSICIDITSCPTTYFKWTAMK